jgi:hypothetical protein
MDRWIVKRLRLDRWMRRWRRAESNTFRLEELVDISAFQEMHVRHVSASLRPYGTESRTMRGLAMTVHGTILRRMSAANATIIASAARRCIGTCIIIVIYRHSGGGCVCGRASDDLALTARKNWSNAMCLQWTDVGQADEVGLMDPTVCKTYRDYSHTLM